ncbi:hypothetical protein MALGJ_38970 [Mycolicibacter algericus]|uniref:Uncharacterized protein n=1 Tax=Mycolicibacter algericus TaxID=1288388 RepID=A0A7I9YEV1_MYCAL|nr:hypothetical protein MALGJ_38970 [Mycolicibacter algericus]
MLPAKVSGCSMNTATACSIAAPVAAADFSMSLMVRLLLTQLAEYPPARAALARLTADEHSHPQH